MPGLTLARNIAQPDDLYDQLVAMHDGLSDRQSAVASSKLILLLANHIGDADIIREAIGQARGSLRKDDSAVLKTGDPR